MNTVLTYIAAAIGIAFVLYCAAYVVFLVVYAGNLFYRWVTRKHPWC